MAFEYVVIDNKRYAVTADGYKPLVQKQRSYDVGLTGKAIIQDFTVENRVPQMWGYRLKVYIETVEPDKIGYGNLADFVAAYHKPYFLLTDHFGISHAVGVPKGYSPMPRVPADLGVQVVYGVFYVDIELIELYGTGLAIPPQVTVPPILVVPSTNPANPCGITLVGGGYLTGNRGKPITACRPITYVLTDLKGNPITDSQGHQITGA